MSTISITFRRLNVAALFAALFCTLAPVGWSAEPKASRGAIAVHDLDDSVVTSNVAYSGGTDRKATGGEEKTVAKLGGQSVTITMSKRIYQIGESLNLSIQSERDCFVRVVQFGADGSRTQLLPNKFQPDNSVKAGRALVLPGPGYRLRTSAPGGEEKLVVYVSTGQFTQTKELLLASRGPFPSLDRDKRIATRGPILIEAETTNAEPAEVIGASLTYLLKP